MLKVKLDILYHDEKEFTAHMLPFYQHTPPFRNDFDREWRRDIFTVGMRQFITA